MKILGAGLIAEALRAYSDEARDALIFARGVSDSAAVSRAVFAQELADLEVALARCVAADLRLVYFSSGGGVYGLNPGRRDEATELRPVAPYGIHKVEAERRIRESGARHLIIRLANAVGSPQSPSQLVPALVRQAVAGRATLHRHATRDVLDVADIARLTVMMLRDGPDRDLIVLARGQSVTAPDLFAAITAVLGISPAVDLVDRGEPQQFAIDHLLDRLGTTAEALGLLSLEDALLRHVPALANIASGSHRS